MKRWNSGLGTGAVILFAVFLSTVFLARNGHGNPMVVGTQISVSPRVADDAVGTRGTVSSRPTEDFAKSPTSMSPDTFVAAVSPRATGDVAESLNANKPSPQSLAPKSPISPIEPVCGQHTGRPPRNHPKNAKTPGAFHRQ